MFLINFIINYCKYRIKFQIHTNGLSTSQKKDTLLLFRLKYIFGPYFFDFIQFDPYFHFMFN